MSDDIYRLVVDNLREGIVITDEQGHVIAWNPAQETMTGIAASTVMGRLIWDVQYDWLPPEQRTDQKRLQLEQDLRTFLTTGSAPWSDQQLQREHPRPDGGIVVTKGRTISIPTARGFLFCCASWDVTQEQQTQNHARMWAERNEKLLQTTLDGYLLVDRSGQLLAVNPAYCRMSGYSEDELLGMNISQLEADLEQSQIAERIRDIFGAGARGFETRHWRKDRSVIDLEVSVSIVETNVETNVETDSEPLLAAFLRDISARRQTQAELEQYSSELETRVAERTAELRRIVDLMAGREIRMGELRGVIVRLRAQLQAAGLQPKADDPLRDGP